ISGSLGKGVDVSGPQFAGKIRVTLVDGQMHLESPSISMPAAAELLAGKLLDRPVIDMTGLTGNYEFALDISIQDMMNAARLSGIPIPPALAAGAAGAVAPGQASDPSQSSSVFTSIQKLGLRLEPHRAPFDTIVVDHAEKVPTEN